MSKGLGSDGGLHRVGSGESQKDTPNPNGVDYFGDSCRFRRVANACRTRSYSSSIQNRAHSSGHTLANFSFADANQACQVECSDCNEIVFY